MHDKQKNDTNNTNIYLFVHLEFVEKSVQIVFEFDHRFFTYSGINFPPFWEPLGMHLGVLGDHLGDLERSVGSLVPSLGASLGHLGPSWLYFDLFLSLQGNFESFQASFWILWEPILEPSGQKIHHLAGTKKFQAISKNPSSRTDQKGPKQTHLRSMQPSNQTVI